MRSIDEAPREIADPIREFFPPEEWDNAASISFEESGWDAFAVNDTTTPTVPCGATLGTQDGVLVSAERSVGFFQVNTCDFPTWPWYRLFNARHNAGTAHMLWAFRGWHPWYFSAKRLGLLE